MWECEREKGTWGGESWEGRRQGEMGGREKRERGERARWVERGSVCVFEREREKHMVEQRELGRGEV